MNVPTLEELIARSHVVSLPLTTPFRGLTHREAIIFDAEVSPAEWSPFLEYDDGEAARWLASAIEQGWTPSPWGKDLPTQIHVNGTIPAVSPDHVEALIERAGHPRTVKVKVGGPGTTLADDVARVAEVRRVLGPTGRIRIDANGSWNVDEAEHAIRAMEPLDLDYVEQPVTSVPEMADIRSRISRLGIQVAADESIRRWSDLESVIAAEACDLVVLKVQPLGGLEATRALINTAEAAGLGVVLSSALDTSVGLYQAAQLQAHLEHTRDQWHDAGLGTGSFFGNDIVTTPLIPQGGVMTISPPELDDDAVQRFSASPERTEWWQQRLLRCWNQLYKPE